MITLPSRIGLCATCQHTRVVKSAKGSTFILCGLAKTDPRFSKYPPLPVIQCPGYRPHAQTGE
ncbi:MAG: hypothetical protein KDI02_04375 [Anaerolineae bacterium]|nr:hypothetical protein [Anaerolineae bacterium]MCB0222902.1 hypothetical protein [Anaerolineae bacterium]